MAILVDYNNCTLMHFGWEFSLSMVKDEINQVNNVLMSTQLWRHNTIICQDHFGFMSNMSLSTPQTHIWILMHMSVSANAFIWKIQKWTEKIGGCHNLLPCPDILRYLNRLKWTLPAPLSPPISTSFNHNYAYVYLK